MKLFKVSFDDATTKGFVTININPGRERLKLLKEINLKTSADGSLVFDDGMVESIIKGAELARKYIVSISLKVNDEDIETFEDLEYCCAFNTIIMRLVGVMLNGPERLGNQL